MTMTHNGTYNSIHLDLSNLNSIIRSSNKPTRLSGWGYSGDYNIQTSWVNKSNDTLKESMLAYTKRMNDIKRLRGINVYKNYSQTHIDYPTLHISNSTPSHSVDLSMDKNRRLYGTNNRLIRSLGTIKLEPLLGSQKSEVDNMSVKVYKVKNEKTRDSGLVDGSRKEADEENIKSVKHIKVTIAIPPAEPDDDADSDDNDDDDDDCDVDAKENDDIHKELKKLVNKDEENQTEEAVVKKKLIPLNSDKKRPRRAKRMKLAKPELDAISEDTPSTRAPTNVSSLDQISKSMTDSYHDFLEEINKTNNLMDEQKKQTVALLKRTNYGPHSHQQEQRMTLQSYAKRKLRRLPPISSSVNNKVTGAASLRYTNALDSSTSPYQHIRAN